MIGCNYNAGNLGGFPIFTFGAPASLCKAGANSKYPGLCDPNEDFSQHENGKIYFKKNASESPVVKQWLKNGKKLNLWFVDSFPMKIVDEYDNAYWLDFQYKYH